MIKASVGLPIYKGKDIAWLCLESLCRQKTNIGWELIIMEEVQGAFGEDEVLKYVDRLKAAGCERLLYVPLDYKISLPNKWKALAEKAQSEVFVFCSADDYHEPNKIQSSYNAISSGHDWTCYNNYFMYCIKTKRYILFDANSIGWKPGALKACRTSDLKNIKDSDIPKGVDRYIYNSIAPKKILFDNSEDWKNGFGTDGYNVISKDRTRHFSVPKKPFFKTELTIESFPNEVIRRLNHLYNRKQYTPPIKVVAVIPVKGRLPLLKHTIERLYNKNGIHKVICVGFGDLEKELCESLGAEFIVHDNKPLGAKWNAGFMAAKKYNPDACLFVGSSDWVSDNWIESTSQYLEEYDLIGKRDFNLLDVSTNMRMCHWRGYEDERRKNEPIGIGRLLSKRILDKMEWQPMDGKLDNSLDYSMYHKVLQLEGKVLLLNDIELQSLSISTDKWENKHKFEDHYSGKLKSEKIENVDRFLSKWFPEGKNIFE